MLVGGLEHLDYFSIYILGISSSQLTNSYFQRGGENTPTRDIYIYIGNFIIPTGPISMIFRGVARYTTNQIFVNAADWWVLFHASWLQDVDVASRPVAGNPRLLWGAFNRNGSPKV
jgi:hypothetical protein